MVLFDWFNNGVALLTGLPLIGILGLFWFTFLFELPRYLLTFVPAILIIRHKMREEPGPMPDIGTVSILIAGHNEADAIEQCVLSLREQTFQDFEIVCVSDGSTDDTYKIMKRLQREGKVQKIAECAVRGGKSSAINLGMRLASGDIVVVIDCDCSFDRTAIEEILRPFADKQVGAVGGSVLVRNGDASITASLQAIEYMVAIQLGKTAMDAVGQLSIISGAFGAFRRDAFMRVGMMDPGPGEDGDITIRLRLYDYKIVFAIRSIAYTDVPTHMFNLLKQRQRWERDALWTRFRKYGRTLNPKSRDFKWKELPHQFDFLVMDVFCGIVAPFYLIWLIHVTDVQFALFIFFVAGLGLLVLDSFTFAMGCLATGKKDYWRFWPFVVLYGPWKGYLMRYARLYTYVDEWIYSASRHDNFAPPKVNDWIRWK
jgi:cellulose synthase/poly-beta-1,6-N-acetylglucosamine synthase-like glycosyltransferase